MTDGRGTCWRRRLLEGGADTGFHHVEPEKYTPRLMHFSGQGSNVVVREVCFVSFYVFLYLLSVFIVQIDRIRNLSGKYSDLHQICQTCSDKITPSPDTFSSYHFCEMLSTNREENQLRYLRQLYSVARKFVATIKSRHCKLTTTNNMITITDQFYFECLHQICQTITQSPCH